MVCLSNTHVHLSRAVGSSSNAPTISVPSIASFHSKRILEVCISLFTTFLIILLDLKLEDIFEKKYLSKFTFWYFLRMSATSPRKLVP